ncbi:MAG: FtsW/RodA/SpoVE family cell cycle protein [Lachnospiraceae bacterium]|nr:FtsW/RodA/SpoVE family cell cycle protein [Lachnospiraceae bacterium]
MSMEEFLNTVTEQIRWKGARGPVSEELKAHILDQAQSYEREADCPGTGEGLTESGALERAVREMGDPVAIGVEMDRIHRPKISWEILVLVGVLSIAGLILHGVLRSYSPEEYHLKRQAAFVVIGYLLMLGVCLLDYNFLGRHSRKIAAGFLLFLIGGTFFPGSYGRDTYRTFDILHIKLNVTVLIYLFVPIFGALLYSYRGQGYKAVGKLALWAAVPMLFLYRLPALYTAVTLGLALALLFTVAAAKDWYRINKKLVLGGLWTVILAVPIAVISLVLIRGTDQSLLREYQADRLLAYIRGGEGSYLVENVEKVLDGCLFMGRDSGNLERAVNLPGHNSDYVLVSLMSAYGIVAGVIVVLLLLWMTGKVFCISMGQKNQLGMIIGSGCGIVFLIQTLFCVLVNLNLCPPAQTLLPFLCYGGNTTIVSYLLLGLCLSICRYQNMPLGRQKSTLRWEIRITRVPNLKEN